MKRQLEKQIKRIRKEENKILNQKENPLLQSTITPIKDRIQGYIPTKLKTTLDIAFYKGFWLVFQKGNVYIEKTYNKNKIQLEYDLNDYAIDRSLNRKYMNRIDKRANQSKLFNSSLSVIEGGVLGLFGIGLPDIPLFISVIMKSIYEVALSYGYHYNTEEEKAYILLLICGSLTKGDQQRAFNKELDILGGNMDRNIHTEINLEEYMKQTASVLSEALLTAKFIQGIPFIGVVGGIVNYNIIRRITKFSSLKYKMRYFIKKRN